MKRRHAIAALIATSISASAAPAEPKTLLILGDSLTEGYGLLPAEAYPSLLQEKLGDGWNVVNGGLSGDTSAGGLRRLGWLMKTVPDMLVIALGGNDGLRGIAPDSTKKNLIAVIEKARAANPEMKILLAGVGAPANLGADFLGRFKATFPAVAEEEKVALLPNLLEGVEGVKELNQGDQIHPNAAGNVKIAETVFKAIMPLLEPLN